MKVVQTRAECNTESMLNIPSESQSLGAMLVWLVSPSVDSHRVEQLSLDTAYCQFANTLFPASIALKKVKLVAERVHRYF